MKILLRWSRIVAVGLIGILLVGFSGLRVAHYPNPIATARLGLAAPSATPKLLPAHLVAPAATPTQLQVVEEDMPPGVLWDGRYVDVEEFFKKTKTNAFLVMRNGTITYEWYNKKFTPEFQFPSYSVAKTLTSLMIGKLISEGKISESDNFIKYFPELANGSSFDKVTIGQLLDMRSGVGVSDNYPTGPSGWGVAIAQMYASTDIPWFMGNNRKMKFEPGTKAEYRSVDTQMLGMIIKKVTGEKVADYFSTNFWQPIGAQYPATWNVDHLGGQEKTFCCFNATARDYARIGNLLAMGGFVGEKQLVSASWITRLSNPVETLDHNWGYGAQIWHPNPGSLMMLGLHSQFVYVVPKTRTVIVKLSDSLNDADEEPTAAILEAIATKIS
jgi:CubicO group peptidase (beta-lactamase class C family)